jgi:hypothetical protein
MSDYNKLSYDELVQINEELRYKIADLKNFKKQQEAYNKCTARVYAPDKSYKDLENKIEKFEETKKKEIDELWTNTIVPLQNQVKDKNIQLDTAYNIDRSNKERIKELEGVITNQNTMIYMAAGYISSTSQFRNQHPMNVLKWLRGISIQ